MSCILDSNLARLIHLESRGFPRDAGSVCTCLLLILFWAPSAWAGARFEPVEISVGHQNLHNADFSLSGTSLGLIAPWFKGTPTRSFSGLLMVDRVAAPVSAVWSATMLVTNTPGKLARLPFFKIGVGIAVATREEKPNVGEVGMGGRLGVFVGIRRAITAFATADYGQSNSEIATTINFGLSVSLGLLK